MISAPRGTCQLSTQVDVSGADTLLTSVRPNEFDKIKCGSFIYKDNQKNTIFSINLVMCLACYHGFHYIVSISSYLPAKKIFC